MSREAMLTTARWLDIIHIPGAIILMIGGPLFLPAWLSLGINSLIIAMQAFFLGCPLTTLTQWLRRKAGEDVPGGSFTMHLYHKYGRWVMVPTMLLVTGLLIFFGMGLPAAWNANTTPLLWQWVGSLF